MTAGRTRALVLLPLPRLLLLPLLRLRPWMLLLTQL
jgi:hypothetical protein